MLSKQQISFVRSLHQKKFRQMYGKFLVEGDKLVRELLTSGFKIEAIFHTKNWAYPVERSGIEVTEVTEQELSKISTHEQPNQVLAIAVAPETVYTGNSLKPGLYLVLDDINDPGNAGTIIRTAEWFGLKAVFLSKNSVEIFNPKVVSAAKGSLFRMPCFYVQLNSFLKNNSTIPAYGAFMDGQNIYKTELNQTAFIVIGNEANGISEELLPFIKKRIAIPSFGKAESLNAAMAAGIIMSEFVRRTQS